MSRITDVIATPIAFRDPPLLNSWGVHEPLALRSVLEIVVDDEVSGWGEGSGELDVVRGLQRMMPKLRDANPYDLNGLALLVRAELADETVATRDAVFAIIEVACLDAQGRLAGASVSELLGGAVRTKVDFAGYLFYKWAGHRDAAGRIVEGDAWGEALDPAGIVRQATDLIGTYGFGSLKLKAGVFEPDVEIETMRALAAAFPGMPLRIDPNGAWTVETSVRVARALEDVLEYLEDPTLGREAMGVVGAATSLPLATNMCVTSFADIPEAVARNSISVVLADHHAWGGLRRSTELVRLCDTFGWGVSMHSNSHLGISLAAMTHLAASSEILSYACDTHYPWNRQDDIVNPGTFTFADGSLAVPTGPGLGVRIDRNQLATLHELYLASGRTTRDDTSYARLVDPNYDPTRPRY